MRDITIGTNEAGQRLDKFLAKYFKEATKSFLYKMLRKKNILLNEKKASGNEKINTGDVVRIYMAEETIEKFIGNKVDIIPKCSKKPDIIYEDENIIIMNKKAGVLSQKADVTDVSMNEIMISYLLSSGALSTEEFNTFHPSVCNRLDRNTSGIILGGKSLVGLQELTLMLKERTLDKYYFCIVNGVMDNAQEIDGYLRKDEKTNKVTITSQNKEDSSLIRTSYKPICNNGKCTLLKVKLITGKTHQIRAHLASVGHGIVGDSKYGDSKQNQYYMKNYGLKHQLLHAGIISFCKNEGRLSYLHGREFKAQYPKIFLDVLEGEGLNGNME